mgnify:CR=1 FL=1
MTWVEQKKTNKNKTKNKNKKNKNKNKNKQERTLKLSMQNLLYFSTSEMDPDANFDSTNQHTTIFIHNPYDLVDLE